jgi:hypothetical protein
MHIMRSSDQLIIAGIIFNTNKHLITRINIKRPNILNGSGLKEGIPSTVIKINSIVTPACPPGRCQSDWADASQTGFLQAL